MKAYVFNKVIYNGNVDRDFYLFCCSKDKRLYLYIFRHIFFYLLGLISDKANEYYKSTYYSFLKKVNNVNSLIKEFSKKYKYKLNELYKGNDNNLIITSSPSVIVSSFLKKEKVIGLDFSEDYRLNKTSCKVNKIYDEYYCNSYNDINLVNAKHKFIKKGHIFISYKDTKKRKVLTSLFKYLFPFLLGLILLLISFQFTTIYLDKEIIFDYFTSLKLLFLNLIPILILLYLLLFLTKRLWISFSINSLLIIIIGTINKTKLFYRDDVLKFEDITLIKEGLLMTQRYDVIIRWYTVLSIILCIVIALLLKKYYKKLELKNYVCLIISILLIIFSVVLYKTTYTNTKLYDSVGNSSSVDTWIATRKSQIRGLIYPLIYSSVEMLDTVPENYNINDAKSILSNYIYEDIDVDKKVNIVAIMLEAYNDFSKFDTIEFTEDVYSKLHKIEDNSLHGSIVVDIFGGGTVETERRFLTGYYNFPTFRKSTNSYVRYFKEQGYQVYAYHPIYGAFYNRNTANYNIGFDEYYNYENRFNIYKGWNNFASDSELYSEIIKDFELNKDKNKFYFAVTYQNHGPYPSTSTNSYIEKGNLSDTSYNTLNNYLSGIKSTNDALYDLVEYIDSVTEPTILIFFGDHNPYLGENAYAYKEAGINIDLLTTDGFLNYYSVPYVIHANSGAKNVYNKSFKGKLNTISSNYIMNELFEYIGLKGNSYLQYTSDIKNNISVINNIYYKEDNKYVEKDNSSYKDIINEFMKVNYYWANDYKE